MEVAALAGLLGLSYIVSKVPGHQDAKKNKQVENFVPAARAPDSSALTQTPKGASAVGFGPELDMMYQTPAGKTYPSEPNPGPYGTALGYSTQKPPLAPFGSPDFAPEPQPIDSNTPLMEYRSDGVEAEPNYLKGDFIKSPLSGQMIATKDFKHNNMQPFFGGRIKQNTAPAANTGLLDAYNGGGSTQVKKREVENMFAASRAPFGNPFGMEDNTDFIQSRVQAPISRNGEKPFEPVRVGAGVGEKFGMTGKGGFQQLEINEIMRPKDTNELRVATNPKETYNQPVVPGKHFITEAMQDSGEVRKYRPDRFYIDETGERFFTTTGDLIKETVRSVQVLPHTTRPETSVEYGGIAVSQDAGQSYVAGTYRTPMSQQYGGAGYRNANMEAYYTKDVGGPAADYGKSAIENRPNERSETSERVMALNAVPADAGNVTIHYNDDARPTRRAEAVGNFIAGAPTRYAGGAPAVTVWDPQDIARTTVKESTIYLDRPGIAGSASAPTKLKTYDPDDIARPTQKSQLSSNLAWYGPSVAAAADSMDPTFAYNMRTNPNKEVVAKGRKPIAGAGGVAIFTGDPGKQKSNKLDTDFINDRAMAVNRSMDLSPGVGDLGRIEYRVPLKLDVSRERNTYDSVSAVDNNPLMQSLRRNAESDERMLSGLEQMLGGRK
jgi:hypothetical protein